MKPKKLIWALLLILLAVGMVVFAVAPEWNPFGNISLWRLIVGAVLLYWIFDKMLFGRGIGERFDIFLPAALLFIVFEKNVAEWIGRSENPNLINNWIVIIAAVLLTIAWHLLFEKKERPNGARDNQLSSSVVYVDASAKEAHAVSNRFGDLKVFFQNADVGEEKFPVHLEVNNRFGEIKIYVPADWYVTMRVNSRLGDVKTNGVKTDADGKRELVVTGTNRFGDVRFLNE